MNYFYDKRVLHVDDVNAAIQGDAARFIAEEEARYRDNVCRVAQHLNDTMPERCLVMLAGPSSAGKTTTANNLRRALEANGRQASIVSLDDFYRGRGLAPRLPDGSYDYESIEALDLPLLQQCMAELINDGVTRLPRFDFNTHAPLEERFELRIEEHSVVIFEGIHALNPVLEEHVPLESVYKIFINVMSRIYDDDDAKLLARRDLRLCRRMLRDYQFRSSSIENTLDMWRQVVRGEELYMFPYVDTANATFDTMHAYEPAMIGPRLLPLLRAVSTDGPYAETVGHLIDALSRFEPLSVQRLPEDSLLREFVGK